VRQASYRRAALRCEPTYPRTRTSRSTSPPPAASRIQAKGILRHYAYGWAEGFALGDGARVLLYEGDFIKGHLNTHGGVDLFLVTVHLMNVKFYLGNYHETDEFDLFPKRCDEG